MIFNEYEYMYYYTLKSKGRTRVVESLNRKIRAHGNRLDWDGLILCSIDEESIKYSRIQWPKYYGEDTHSGFVYSWERLYYKFLHRPSFFDLAIWQYVDGRKVLQGMALGKPSNAKTHLSLNWVERSFEPTYFKGGMLLPVLACAEEYAKLLGSERVLIKDAVDPEKYEKYGYAPFRLPKVGQCLAKELCYGES